MRKILWIVLAALMAFACSTEKVSADNGAAVMVCGESSLAGGAAEKDAVEDAKKKAVRKVLARFMAPDDTPDSLFQQIVSGYDSYMMDKPKVMKKQKAGNKTLAFCNISVNITTLENSLKRKIRGIQESGEHEDDGGVFFFVRVASPAEDGKGGSRQAFVTNVYEHAFQKLSFHKAAGDEISAELMRQYEGLDRKGYFDKMRSSVSQNMEIGLAVIGEITMAQEEIDETGANASCECNMILVRNGDDGELETIGSFNDSYFIRRPTAEEADTLVLQKAAYNSSKVLSQILLDYWQTKK